MGYLSHVVLACIVVVFQWQDTKKFLVLFQIQLFTVVIRLRNKLYKNVLELDKFLMNYCFK